jgi:hypothetical protein
MSESKSEPDFKLLYEQKLSENDLLKKEVEILTDHLKKYTAPTRSKKYYEHHKDEILKRQKEYNKAYMKELDPEKIKEYNKRAYQKRKQKNQNDENK